MTPRLHVLLVEDDARLARATVGYLEHHDMRVTWAGDGKSALERVFEPGVDLVVLDLMLPDGDGLGLCRLIRSRSPVPILVVTGRVEVDDRVIGLEAGADDYLTKPYAARELVARIFALSRRASSERRPLASRLRVGQLVLDLAHFAVLLDGEPLSLTSDEFALLRALAENAGQVLSREQLLERTGGQKDEGLSRAIDVRISRLRHKLRDDSRSPSLLKTIRGAGYVLLGEAEEVH